MLLSAQIVNAYASTLPAGRARRASWDFEEESPLRDARGFDLGGERHGRAGVHRGRGGRRDGQRHPAQRRAALRRPRPPGVLQPEVTNPLDVVRWDKAGELVMARGGPPRRDDARRQRADQPLQEQHRQQGRLLRRARELPDAAATPRSRRSCGTSSRSSSPARSSAAPGGSASARTGARRASRSRQRADFFEVEVGLETTLKRPIINTRDEPHADADRYRRLHVIIGDANLVRDLDLPQGRHDRAGAGDDRGRTSSPTT